MRFSSLHTHTLFCDGHDDVETMCRAAFDKGLSAIGFSSHAPIYKKTGIKTKWHMADEKLGEYVSEVNAARLRWQGRLNVFLGLEVDYIKGLRSAMDSDIRALPLDYIIGSVHYIVPANGAQPFTVDGAEYELEEGIRGGFNGDGQAMMHAYWDTVAEMIALGGFDIAGHLDLVKKNNKDGKWFSMENDEWHSRLCETAAALGGAGCAAELNTGFLNRGKYDEPCPSPAFLRLLREQNVPLVITADAHRARDLDGNYESARRALLEAGYAEHALFEGKAEGHARRYAEQITG